MSSEVTIINYINSSEDEYFMIIKDKSNLYEYLINYIENYKLELNNSRVYKFLLLYIDLIEESKEDILYTFEYKIKPIVSKYQYDLKIKKIIDKIELNISIIKTNKKNNSYNTKNNSFQDISLLDTGDKFNTDTEYENKTEIQISGNCNTKRRISRVSQKIMNYKEEKTYHKNIINDSNYIFEEEKESINIIKNNKNEILFVSFDLMLWKICKYELENKMCIYIIDQMHCIIMNNSLIDKIEKLFENIIKKENPIALINFLNNYVINKYEDEIINDKMIKNKFHSFYKKVSEYGICNTDTLYDILDLFELENNYDIEYTIKQLKGRKKSQNISIKYENIFPSSISSVFDVNEWPATELARQFTIISHYLFSKIKYNELLNTNWTKKDKMDLSPNVCNIINRFNNFNLWIIEEILSYDKKRMRAGAIEKFIQIAIECKNIYNFNDCITIVTALNNHIVKCLNKTWKVINKTTIESFNKLTEFCSFEKNYIRLRDELEMVKSKPCVPYLGLLLKDLAYIEEGPKYIKDKNLINLEKIYKVGSLISGFNSYNSQAYNFRPIPQLFFLADVKPKKEEELEKLCQQIEPIFILSKTKILKKRITNTDSKVYTLNPSLLETQNCQTGIEHLIKDDHY